ncbi:uncharacterized protein PHACADRAFT_120006, partial [Phanerochaete carnosa HHB-10118-sp]
MANGLFVFATTVIEFIEDPAYNDPAGQLKRLASTAVSAGSHRLLDTLYLQVLETAFPEISDDLSVRLKSVLGSIVIIQDHLPVAGLSCLVGLTAGAVYDSLIGLHSVLVVPESETSTSAIRIIHPSFADFLVDSDRCTNGSFAINSRQQHTDLLRGCLNTLRELKRDICNVRDPSLLNTEIPNLLDQIEKAIPAHLRYACRHWYTHLMNGELLDEILDALLEFVQKQLPYWVEACSVLGVLREAISGLSESRRKLTVSAVY